jgi:hypothetical protein
MTDSASPSRRDLLLAPLLAALPLAFMGKDAAAGVDPAMTVILQKDQITWEIGLDRPPRTVEYAYLSSKPTEPGPYLSLVKWYPGFMSAPHWYESDRHCIVLSGTWWVASGDRFDPGDTVPVPAGGFIRRVAKTPHFDGVQKEATEPAVIAIFGIGPIKFHMTEEGKPSWRVL